jgi:alkylation response protein AidB-like acyl-CoA dehydrogenase
MLYYCEDPSIIGTPFFIMERVEGRVFTDNAIPAASPGERTAIYAAMADTLVKLHSVDIESVGLRDFVTTAIRRDGEHYVINGRKWFITGAANPACKVAIVMGKTAFGAEIHRQQSMRLVPLDTPGVHIVRDLTVMHHHSHVTHAEILFDNVRVPASNLLGQEGDGFAMAQARLGPGRIHHCMRCIGQSELALELMVDRVQERKAFGRPPAESDSIQQAIARSSCEIEQARLLVLRAAWMIDNHGTKAARNDIALIKVVQQFISRHRQVGSRVPAG